MLKKSKLVLTVCSIIRMLCSNDRSQSLLDQLPEINRETLKKLTAHLLK